MLAGRSVAATIPAADMDRAKRWYDEKLGLKPSSETIAGALYELGGGSAFFLYPTTHAGKAPNTLMGFVSADVEGDVAALKQKGVVFEDIDEGDLKTVNSVATIGKVKGAWFRDSENNILSITSDPREG